MHFSLFLWLISNGIFNTARDREQDQEWAWNQLTMSLLYTTVNTVSRQGERPGPIISYCMSPLPCTASDPGSVQCE